MDISASTEASDNSKLSYLDEESNDNSILVNQHLDHSGEKAQSKNDTNQTIDIHKPEDNSCNKINDNIAFDQDNDNQKGICDELEQIKIIIYYKENNKTSVNAIKSQDSLFENNYERFTKYLEVLKNDEKINDVLLVFLNVNIDELLTKFKFVRKMEDFIDSENKKLCLFYINIEKDKRKDQNRKYIS